MSKPENPGHQIDRFLEYTLYQDEKGFFINENGQKITFDFDKDGGWFDEYGNYYNKDGTAADPPQYDENEEYTNPHSANRTMQHFDEFDNWYFLPDYTEEDSYNAYYEEDSDSASQ